MYVHIFATKVVKIGEAIKVKSFNNEYHKLMVNLQFSNSWLQEKLVNWLKPYNLTLQQFNVLRILRGQHPKPASINIIIERMLDKSSNASRLVEKLRVKHLVDRSTNQFDRRQVDVLITQKGLDLLLKVDNTFTSIEDQFKHLSIKEAETLNNLLDKFRTHI